MDPIANMISTIKNAIANNNDYVLICHSKIKEQIAENLKRANYIENTEIVKDEKQRKQLKLTFKFRDEQNILKHLKRISKPGLRKYIGYKSIPRVLGGFGDVLISTPKGIMFGKNARAKKLGGEIICEVY